MNNKMWIYAGLLVVILAAMGIGIWLVSTPGEQVTIPEGDPVIVMDISNIEGGEQIQLSIYDGGEIIYWKDTGLATVTASGTTATRTWRTGTLSSEDIEELFDSIKTTGFDNLEEYYQATGTSPKSGVIDDGYCTIAAERGDIDNRVTAYGFFNNGSSDPYSALPDPLDDIYEELMGVIENDTEEALTEKIPVE